MFKTISSRLIASIGCMVCVLIALAVTSQYITMRDNILQASKDRMLAELHQAEILFAEKGQTAKSLASWIAADKEIAAALASRNREELLARLLPTYNALKEPLNLSQFQFHLSPATSFLRLHQPEKHGDDLSALRSTVVKTNETRSPQVGLDGGAFGLGIRGVVPVFHQGVHVGSVEFGVAVNDALVLPLKEKFGFDFSILAPKGDAFDFVARTHKMPTSPDLVPTLRDVYENSHTTFKRVDKAGKQLYTAYFPLKDYTGKTIAVMAIPSDISKALADMNFLLFVMVGVGLVALLGSAILVSIIIRRIVGRPLNTTLLFLDKIAGGDYSSRLDGKFCCEMATLAKGINTMTDSVAHSMEEASRAQAAAVEEGHKVKQALEEAKAQEARVSELLNTLKRVAGEADTIATQVSSASEELAAQVEQVSRGAEMQRDRVDSTASAMTEMNATVLEVARSAGEASEQSELTRTKADDGYQLVSRVVQSMHSVNKVTGVLHANMQGLGTQAESIGGVMNVISDIADQTNLLALNAAIEAARAGEAGRGFAVVADEVRKLAEKTMQATQEVGGNITAIQHSAKTSIESVAEASKAVAEATELANSSGEALTEIVNFASASSALVTSIATAAEEQSATSEEINRAIDEINHVVRENADGMVQASSAVQELSHLAHELSRVMGELK